jgi:hypothetical protein
MQKTLIIGDNEICKLVPGKRYILKIFGGPAVTATLTPFETDPERLYEGYFTAQPGDVEKISWTFPGASSSAGFEFTATLPLLFLESDSEDTIEVDVFPIE